MIINCQSDYQQALLYDVCDAATLEPIDYSMLWYADDSAGIIRRYIEDGHGIILSAYESDPQTPLTANECRKYARLADGTVVDVTPPICAAWREERLPIRIMRKRDE